MHADWFTSHLLFLCYLLDPGPIVAHETRSPNQPADTDCDEDDDLSEDDRILERRMREALVQAQANFNTRIKEEHIQNADTCPVSVTIETTSSTRNTPSENRTNGRQRPIRGSTSRGSKYRGWGIGLRALSVRIQQQVAKRAEASVQRYDAHS
ncbi:unnamed protein product [Phytophthora fragariaefolia]|uniref:Unnamed protein product n=1 Tax=Phytophthora fragariaefolia TaxID=1490495 RepID=A0A9W6TV64_9STRA|nr:unnamed protein product [Phytophthora fragariaefolia]